MRRPLQLASLLALLACLIVIATGFGSAASGASTCPVEPPASSPLKLGLSASGTSIVVLSAPAGTATIDFAEMKDTQADGIVYAPKGVKYPLAAPLVPAAGLPVVDGHARDATGKELGTWAGRIETHAAAPPPPPPSTFQPGIVSNAEPDYVAVSTLGAHLARVGFSLGETNLALHVGTVASTLAKSGTALQPLIGFAGRMPTAAEARSLGAVAAAVPLVKRFEFGNETSYGYQYGDTYSAASYKARARAYALRVKEAAEAVSPYGDGIEAQADDGGSGSANWVNEMFAAVPTLASYVAGWVVHPYGTGGPGKVERMIADLAARGETKLPIDVTEFGISTDNGRTLSDNYGFPTNLTYAAAAKLLPEAVAKIVKIAGPRLRSFLVYQGRDQKPSGTTTGRESYFGALQSNGTAKGAYTTAVKALLAE